MEIKVTCNLLKYKYRFFGITVASCLATVIIVIMSDHYLPWKVTSFLTSNQRAMTSYNCGLGCNVTESISQQHAPVVLKTVYSEHVRFVFFAGLEKTGHHFLQHALQPCQQSGICIEDHFLHRAIFPHGQGNLSTADDAVKQQDTIVMRLRLLKKQWIENSTPNKPHVAMLNVLQLEHSNVTLAMLAYPTINGNKNKNENQIQNIANRYMNNPDIVQIAALAESAGVDLRIVLLVRDMAEIIRSLMKKMPMQIFLEKYELTRNSMMNLGHQLALLDKRFIVCFDLDRYTDQTQLDTVASALISPTKFQADFGKYLRKPLLDIIRTNKDSIHAGNSWFRLEARKWINPSQLRLSDQLSLHIQYLRGKYC